MAAMLQQYPHMYNVLPHDLESFVYALDVPVLQFQQHNLNKAMLADYFRWTFDGAMETDGLIHGGQTKGNHVKHGEPEWELCAEDSPLATLINNLYRLLQSQWESFSKSERRAITAHWGVPGPRNPNPEEHPIPDLVASRPMATHDAMDKIFEDALAAEGWDDERLKKTTDQFIGLFDGRPIIPHQADTSGNLLTTHKRAHGSDDKEEDDGPAAKKFKPTTSELPLLKRPAGPDSH